MTGTSSTNGRAAATWAALPAVVAVWAVPDAPVALGLGAVVYVVTWILCGSVPRPLVAPTGLLALVVAVGARGQVALGASAYRVLAFVVLGVVVLVLARAGLRRLVDPVERRRPPSPWVGAGLVAVALVLRLALPVLTGATTGGLANGQVVLPVAAVQIGEVTRVLLLVGVGLVVHSLATVRGLGPAAALRTPVGATTTVLVGIAVGTLVVLDMGPALLTGLGIGVLLWWGFAPARRRPGRRALAAGAGLSGALVAVAAAVPYARDKIVARVSLMGDPGDGTQIGYALNALRSGGLVGRGFADAQFVHQIPLASTDMFPAAVGSALGLLALVGLTIALLGSLLAYYRAVLAVGGPHAVVVSALLLVMTAQATISILGNVAFLPLTGVSAPMLVVTGTSTVMSCAVLGAAQGVTDADAAYDVVPDLPLVLMRRMVAVTSALVVAAAGLAVLILVPPTAAARLGLERGDVLARDGSPLAEWDPTASSRRAYADPELFGVVGAYDWSTRTASGIEARYNAELTCGGSHTLTERLGTLVRPLECRPADLATTLDPATQQAAADALSEVEGAVVVLDAPTGEVLADVSTFEEHTAEGPLGSVFKVVVAAAAFDAGIDNSEAPTASLELDGESIRNSQGMVCPASDLVTAIQSSCNTVLGWDGVQLGQRRLGDFATTYFGTDRPLPYDGAPYRSADLGLATGLGSAVRMPDVALARTSFGQQSVRATTLSAAMVASTVLNGTQGRRAPAPHVVAGRCENGAWLERADPELVGSAALPVSAAEQTYDAMRAVADGHTMGQLDDHGRTLAGKTGTADAPRPGGAYDTRSWLVITVDERLVVAAQVYVDGTVHSNQALPVVQRVLDVLPEDVAQVGC